MLHSWDAVVVACNRHQTSPLVYSFHLDAPCDVVLSVGSVVVVKAEAIVGREHLALLACGSLTDGIFTIRIIQLT